MKNLFLLTNAFPYGNWEPYLETEVKFYDQFDKVWIFALQIRQEHLKNKRPVGKNATVVPVLYAPRVVYLLHSIVTLVDLNLYKELVRLIRGKRLNKTNLIHMFVFFSRAHYEAGIIAKRMKVSRIKDVIFYSYRFEYQPYVAILLKKKWKLNSRIIARAHRYDLYEEEHAGNYIPMRKGILDAIDYVYPCSENGKDYILNAYPQYKNKVVPRFLGTIDCGVKAYTWGEAKIQIVSCSNVVEVKRLDKLIGALALIKEIPIKWTHYGDGVLMPAIKKQAAEKFGKNIEYEFKGNIDNSRLLKEYGRQNYYLFLNVSSSEGIPVSIMEAASFGIPCIATNVGGTGEIISDGDNGILLSENPTEQEIAEAIRAFCWLDKEAYEKFRHAARERWDEKYNAEKNYREFVKELQEIKD